MDTPTPSSTRSTPTPVPWSLPTRTHPSPSDPAFIGYSFPYRGRQWKIHEKTAHKNGKMAWIWSVGAEVRESNKPSLKNPYWLCLRCWCSQRVEIKGTTSTSPAIQHMLIEHQLTQTGPIEKPEAPPQTALQSVERPVSFSNLVTQVSVTAMNQALITWIILAHIALNCVENDAFRAFIQLLNPSLFEYLYHTGASIKVLILRDFAARKERVRQRLSKSKSKIHISFDLWTSSNSLAMLGIVAHYLDESLVSKSLIIAMRELKGDHSGLSQSKILASVIREFEVQDSIGYFISDNATSNDLAVFHTCEELKLADPTHRRLRCLGHIINLAAKAFLFGSDSGSFDFEISQTARLRLEVRQALEILAFWRKKGPIGKLHNIIIWTSRSSQRLQAFKTMTYDFPEVRNGKSPFLH
jgi:hypothetical protein